MAGWATVDDLYQTIDYRMWGGDAFQPLPSPGNAIDEIDESVKNNVAVSGPRPTDEEIRLACAALRRAGWEYMGIDILGSGLRTTTIAAAINAYTSGSRMVDYCSSE